MEGKIGRKCKIRKRGCSSSSSSSLVHKYRFKRAILVGKRAGSSTPVPTWKTNTRSTSIAMQNAEFPNPLGSRNGGKGKPVSVSARKLAATLWEINGVPKDMEVTMKNKKELRSREKFANLSQSGSLPPHLSDPSYSPEMMDKFKGSQQRRMSGVSQKVQRTDYYLGGLDSISNASLMEIETHSVGKTHSGRIVGVKTRLKDVSNGLTTSKELLKVLNRIWGVEQQHSSGTSLVSALRVELDRARTQVNQLIRELRSNRTEIDCLMKQFAEEKATWKSKERERIRDAIACVSEELEVEKKLRGQTERLNKKLGKELADSKASLSKATKELESEKRAKEILEQVCDELARGIGEDRAEVEELKKESEKVREEVEKEREMLQLADVLREERVQMKLSEAKYHFEEKNAAVEKLRNELEGYLRSKIGKKSDGSPNSERSKELKAFLVNAHFGSFPNGGKRENEGEVVVDGEEHEGDDDSADSDLHSIELNMDNNCRSYKWSYACEDGVQDDSKRVSVEKEAKGRKSIEKIHWGNISLGRETQDNSDEIDRERISEVVSQAQAKDYEDEIKRYKSVKGLRDHIISSSKSGWIQNFASPTRQWDPSNEAWETSKVLKGGTKGERRHSTSLRR